MHEPGPARMKRSSGAKRGHRVDIIGCVASSSLAWASRTRGRQVDSPGEAMTKSACAPAAHGRAEHSVLPRRTYMCQCVAGVVSTDGARGAWRCRRGVVGGMQLRAWT